MVTERTDEQWMSVHMIDQCAHLYCDVRDTIFTPDVDDSMPQSAPYMSQKRTSGAFSHKQHVSFSTSPFRFLVYTHLEHTQKSLIPCQIRSYVATETAVLPPNFVVLAVVIVFCILVFIHTLVGTTIYFP